jgi:serine/threonine protein kinase
MDTKSAGARVLAAGGSVYHAPMRSRRVGPCLSDDTVVAHLSGLLDEAEFERTARHLASCPDCALLLVVAAAGVGGDARSERSDVTGDVAERFELIELIGTGGMASVYRARDRSTCAIVAVKRLGRFSVDAAYAAVERFVQESRILERLAHPNIVRVITTTDRGGEHQIVMEYVAGGSLRQTLRAKGRLSPERALAIALELSDALARAHHLGVIHRDVKPENVLMAEDGTPRLADFGLARLAEAESTSRVLVGTVPYLSPEALSGARLDDKTDLWALGVLLFEMLVGQRPFRGDTPAAVRAAILGAPMPPLTLAGEETAPELISLTCRLLSRERDARPSAREAGAALEAIIRARSAHDCPPAHPASVCWPPPAKR